MNRELKFRAWNGKDRMWYSEEGHLTFGHPLRDEKYHWSVYLYGGKFLFDTFSEGSVLMQSTGFKDKNGKLIYEGDILKHSEGHLGFVRFDYGWAIEYSKQYSHDMPKDYCKHLEIVGDKYRNHDLLKK